MRHRAAGAAANLIPVVEARSAKDRGAWRALRDRGLSRGGMQTKIEAAKIATTAGTHMVIASGRVDHALQAIADGGRCTWFLSASKPGDVAQEVDRGFARAARGH